MIRWPDWLQVRPSAFRFIYGRRNHGIHADGLVHPTVKEALPFPENEQRYHFTLWFPNMANPAEFHVFHFSRSGT